MSSLDDADSSTLEAALAFIDSFESTTDAIRSDHSSQISSCIAAVHSPTGVCQRADENHSVGDSPTDSNDGVNRECRIRSAQASARFYHKKRDELLRLRKQAELLGIQLAAIKDSRRGHVQLSVADNARISLPPSPGGVSADQCSDMRWARQGTLRGGSSAFETALVERQLRQKAEMTNHQLREELQKQRRITSQLSLLIEKRVKPRVG